MLAFSDRIYRALLGLYPAEHRCEYGGLMAQVRYLYDPVDTALRRQMDLKYVERRSLLLDVRLLARQFWLLLRPR